MKSILFTLIFHLFIFSGAQTKVLYGMTNYGGVNNGGVIFTYNPASKAYSKKFDFDYYTTGGNPFGSLIKAFDGRLYGMLYGSNDNINGNLFNYNPATNTTVHHFNFDGINGSNPYGSLLQATNGLLYGMTNFGGVNNKGVIFTYDPTNNIHIKKYDFVDSQPSRSNDRLVQFSSDLLFGTSDNSIFCYNISTNIFTRKVNLEPDPNTIISMGYSPSSSLVLANDGLLYGTNYHGGTNGVGVIFSYNPVTEIYTKKFDFSTLNGGNPYGSLMQASNGLLYGLTRFGGANGVGVLYSYDPISNIYNKKADFSTINGKDSYGNLMQASNGLLYGMTSLGGTNNLGVLFSFDITTGIYSKEVDFDGLSGSAPFGSLIELDPQDLSINYNSPISQFEIFPNPVKDIINFSEEVSNIRILDVSGRVIQQISDTKKSVNLSKLLKGNYIISATKKSGEVISKKFIKE